MEIVRQSYLSQTPSCLGSGNCAFPMDLSRMEPRDFGEDIRFEFGRSQPCDNTSRSNPGTHWERFSSDRKPETTATTSSDNAQTPGTLQEEPIGEATDVLPPEGGRLGWTQVLASFLINMNIYGLVNAFGEFQHFHETDYLKQYSSSEISWIGTMQGSLTLFVGALSGPIFDGGYFKVTLNIPAIALVFS